MILVKKERFWSMGPDRSIHGLIWSSVNPLDSVFVQAERVQRGT